MIRVLFYIRVYYFFIFSYKKWYTFFFNKILKSDVLKVREVFKKWWRNSIYFFLVHPTIRIYKEVKVQNAYFNYILISTLVIIPTLSKKYVRTLNPQVKILMWVPCDIIWYFRILYKRLNIKIYAYIYIIMRKLNYININTYAHI